MIKSVLQSIPTYVMSIFQLPSKLIDSIEKMMNSFWWGHGKTTQRGIHWMNWEKLSAPKMHGGMGFKDLSAFSLAMLGKQVWKFITEPNSLVARIFKARYFPSSSYLTTTVGHNPSYVWRSIMRARFVVRGGARWSIGSGASISILNEPWLSNGEFISSDISGAHFVHNFTINSLMNLHEKVGMNRWLDRYLVWMLQIKYFTRHLSPRLMKIELFGKRKDTDATLYVVLTCYVLQN
jgi:hypothetical protein